MTLIRASKRCHRGVRLTGAGRHFIAGVPAGIAQLEHAVRTAGAEAYPRLHQVSNVNQVARYFGSSPAVFVLQTLEHRKFAKFPLRDHEASIAARGVFSTRNVAFLHTHTYAIKALFLRTCSIFICNMRSSGPQESCEYLAVTTRSCHSRQR